MARGGGARDGAPLGTTQLVASFADDGGYQIDITVDPDALLTRLEIRQNLQLTASVDRAERDRRIGALMTTGDAFRGAIRISFDGVPQVAGVEYRAGSRSTDLAEAAAVVHLRGVRPASARAFSIAYDLAAGWFALVVRVGSGPVQTIWLENGRESSAVSLVAPRPPTHLQVARQYFTFGFTHILPNGIDHILFLVGLFLLVPRWRVLLAQAGAFTLAHALTLGLTLYGVVSIPARMVEPMLAVSIVYVAIENLITTELKSWRVALVFSFGLLHGMGFAGVLHRVGLPRQDFLTALLTFNAGIEAGQLTILVMAFVALAYWKSNRLAYRHFIAQPASVAIGITALYWTAQRLL